MSGVSRGANLAIASKFPWSKYRTVADAGPAQGDLLVQVALHNQHLMGIGFDLPEVGPIFEEYVSDHGLSERLIFQGGSFFTDPLPQADVIMMGHILHDWNLDEKRDADSQGLGGASRRRRVPRLRRRNRRRPLKE